MPDATSLPPEHDAMTDRDPATGHPRPPRREFKARGSFVKRCEGCNLPELNCLCPYQVKAAVSYTHLTLPTKRIV